jgi:hypothetical protein
MYEREYIIFYTRRKRMDTKVSAIQYMIIYASSMVDLDLLKGLDTFNKSYQRLQPGDWWILFK